MSATFYSAFAGLFACLASVTAKIAFGSEFLHVVSEKLVTFVAVEEYEFFVTVTLRIVFAIAFLLCNMQMWTLHAKALNLSRTTLQCVVINTATNFTLTGFVGTIFFGEIHSLLWWMGLTSILFGTAIIVQAQLSEEKEKKQL